MRTCALVTAVAFLAGCTNTYNVSVDDVESIRPNKRVTLVSGEEVRLGESFQVRALPYPEAVLIPSRDCPGVYWIMHASQVPAGETRLRETPWLESPVRVVPDGPTLFFQTADQETMRVIPIAGVRTVQVEQSNYGRTTALIIGVSLAALVVGSLGYYVYQASRIP
ncbi:MAG: hypothetical protein U0441_17460 [Polyangiaceae bacterium]